MTTHWQLGVRVRKADGSGFGPTQYVKVEADPTMSLAVAESLALCAIQGNRRTHVVRQIDAALWPEDQGAVLTVSK